MLTFFRSGERIRREAADWKVRLEREPSAEVLRQFDQWRNCDPRHEQAYARISAIWSEAAKLSPADDVVRPLTVQPAQSRRYALAASIAALLLASGFLLPRLMLGSDQVAILATQIGQTKSISLADGTTVTLFPGSRARAVFNRTERRVSLHQGQARFRVSNEVRAFIVEVHGHEVIGSGATFEVAADPPNPEVIPLEGTIEARRSGVIGTLFGGTRRAEPGQKLVLSDGEARVEPAQPIEPSAMMRFDNVQLGEAVRRFNLDSSAKLSIVGEASNYRLTGSHRAGDAQGFARSLAAAFSLKIEPQPDGSLLLSAAR